MNKSFLEDAVRDLSESAVRTRKFLLDDSSVGQIRRTQHGAGIFAVNLIFGWTVLGWIAPFIWALVEKASPKATPARPLLAETDAWNFHPQQSDEDSAICQGDHWVLGIEDLVESAGNR